MNSRKRILFFGIKTFPSRGGTDRVAENLIRNLQDDFDITLFCYEQDKSETHQEKIRVIRFRPLFSGSLGALIYFMQSTVWALLMDLDLIHVHKTECAPFIPLLRIRHKVIATSHEAAYLRDKWNGIQKLYFKMAEWLFIRTPNLATCISAPLTEYYQQRYGQNVVFIPNGISPVPQSRYNFEGARMVLPSDADPNKSYVLFAARRLMSTKGCHTLLQALHKISYTGQIFIAGEINHHGGYMNRVANLAKGLNVHFLGFVHPLETMLALISKCQVFVFPSETEGMSIMLLEAASAGTPVIASNIPENKLFEEEEILYFKNKEPDDLANKISYALDHPMEMKVMGNRLQLAVTERYNWSWIAQEYRTRYLDTIDGHHAISVDLE